MNRHEVYKMLKEHHEKTSRVMNPVQMIIAAGEETDPASIIDAVHMFNRYLDNQRRKTA